MNQRIGKRHLPPLNDVVTDLGEGNNLIQLVEILAEKPCTAKLHANPRFKAQKLENVSHGLQFCWDCGVTVALKPSPENLIDGDQPAVLGLIWALVGLSFSPSVSTSPYLYPEHMEKMGVVRSDVYRECNPSMRIYPQRKSREEEACLSFFGDAPCETQKVTKDFLAPSNS